MTPEVNLQQDRLTSLIDNWGIDKVMAHPAIRTAVAEALVLAEKDKDRAVARRQEACAKILDKAAARHSGTDALATILLACEATTIRTRGLAGEGEG